MSSEWTQEMKVTKLQGQYYECELRIHVTIRITNTDYFRSNIFMTFLPCCKNGHIVFKFDLGGWGKILVNMIITTKPIGKTDGCLFRKPIREIS